MWTRRIAGIEIGGVNLIRDSETYTLAADGADTYWIAADELEPGMTYTLSVREIVLSAGQAAGVTWKVVNRTDGAVHTSGLLDFTYGKQSVTFTLPETEGNWALFLYAGVSGATTGVTVSLPQGQAGGRQHGDVMERRPGGNLRNAGPADRGAWKGWTAASMSACRA